MADGDGDGRLVISRATTVRLGTFSVAFMGLCVAVFVLLDSADWMLAVGVLGLAYTITRTVWFVISPPWQLRTVSSGEAVELRSHTRLVRSTLRLGVSELDSVGPIEPYGSNQWQGAAAAAKLGQLLGLSEVAIRANGDLHRVIGTQADLAVPLLERLRKRAG